MAARLDDPRLLEQALFDEDLARLLRRGEPAPAHLRALMRRGVARRMGGFGRRGERGRRRSGGGGPVNTAAPSISGTPTVGSTLTRVAGTWTGSPTITGQWLRDGVAISGATGTTHTVVADDVGAEITYRETADGSTTATSAAVQWTPISQLGGSHYLDAVIAYRDPASASNTTVSGDMDVLADLASLSNDLSAPSAGARPDIIEPAELSGYDVIRGDGSTKRLTGTMALGGADLEDITVAMVVKEVSYPGGRGVYYLNGGGGEGGQVLVLQNGFNDLRWRGSASAAYSAVGTGDKPLEDDLYRVFVGQRDGTATTQSLWFSDTKWEADEFSDLGDTSTGGSPGEGADEALLDFTAGTVPAAVDVGPMVVTSDLLSSAERSTLYAYWRNTVLYSGGTAPGDVPFCGTRSTNDYDQPRPYPSAHEGQSGNAIFGVESRMCGTWTGGDTDLGDPGDPGAGSRGSMEDLVVDQSLTGIIGVLMVGTNNASSSAIPQSDYQNLVRRLWSIADGGVDHIFLCEVTGRTDNATANTRIDTFNTALPGLISTLSGEGISCSLVETNDTFNTGTMLSSDGLHPNRTGMDHIASVIGAALSGAQLAALAAGTARMLCMGDSITEGGESYVISGYRGALAREIASLW